jgi:hypothetical protein
VADYVSSSGIADITAFGGPASVSDNALNMVACDEYRLPSASVNYDCAGGLQYSIYNPNTSSIAVTVSLDVNGDGRLDRTVESVSVDPGSSYQNYGAGAIPEGTTANVVLQARGETFYSQLVTPHCITAFPTATASYSCSAGLQYAIQNPNRAAVTVTVSTDDSGDGVIDRLLQTVQVGGESSYANYSAGSLPEDKATNIIFQMNGQTFASKLLTPDCVAAPPSPIQQWANATFGWFNPEGKAGSGDGFYNLPAGARGGAATITYQGGSNFVVWALNAQNEKVDLLVNEIGSYSGTVSWGVVYGSSGAVKLQISSSGPWTVKYAPVSSLPGIQSQSSGDGVFLYDGGPSALNLFYPGSGYFGVWETKTGTYQPLDTDLLVNEIGPYSGSVPLRNGYSVIDVSADGAWAASVG